VFDFVRVLVSCRDSVGVDTGVMEAVSVLVSRIESVFESGLLLDSDCESVSLFSSESVFVLAFFDLVVVSSSDLLLGPLDSVRV
jgi:hypothetical protein